MVAPMIYDLSSHRFLVLIIVSGVGFMLWNGLRSSQKVDSYSHDIHATTVPVGISCQASYTCNWQDSYLGMSDDCFSLLVACMAPPGTVN